MGVKQYNSNQEHRKMKKDPLEFDEKEEIATELMEKELGEQ